MAKYRADFESSKQVLECDNLKQLVKAVCHDFRWDFNHMEIPESTEPFETVRISGQVINGSDSYWHLFSMYMENDFLWENCIVISCGQTANVQVIWKKEDV